MVIDRSRKTILQLELYVKEQCKQADLQDSPAHAVLFQTAQRGGVLAMHGHSAKNPDPLHEQRGIEGCYAAQQSS
jgi:hypothetical protein